MIRPVCFVRNGEYIHEILDASCNIHSHGSCYACLFDSCDKCEFSVSCAVAAEASTISMAI